jgi:Mg-chelatase subunit ChlD
MLLFTDGKSKERSARRAMAEARAQGVSISTLLLGSDAAGAAILQEIAEATGGSFVAVTEPKHLPDAFLNLRSSGVTGVALRVNESDPVPARLAGGAFSAEVPLEVGENRIVAEATSVDGRAREDSIHVTVRPPGCAELTVRAERDGKPTLSLSSRAVAIVVDASGSMWGRMGSRTKIEIAKQILDDALDWLPSDLSLSLRAYGHAYDHAEHNCEDTQLLVSTGLENRDAIREAIADLRPKGQTPLG